MHIAITGSTGLVGLALKSKLIDNGHSITSIGRRRANGDDSHVTWDPAKSQLDAQPLNGCDAVVHLAGENIASARWSDTMKARIRDSRVGGTRLLSESLAKLSSPPKVLVAASAIGFYGDRGDEMLSEDSPPGDDFLAEVCQQWEDAANPLHDVGTRIVHLRIGVVLAKEGGALEKMLTPFRLGVGGVVGNGRQYWSWIAIDDVVGAIQHAIVHETVTGPVNTVAPDPPTNREFTKALGKVLGRPTIFPMPAFVAKIMLGEMAESLLLASTRVSSQKLIESGYKFQHRELEGALRHLLTA